jgi:hypothetical protein
VGVGRFNVGFGGGLGGVVIGAGDLKGRWMMIFAE